MSGLDLEGVLAAHAGYEWWPMTRQFICTCEASIGTSYPDPAHRAHVAAVLREQIAEAWDEGYEAAECMARCWGHTDYWEDEPGNPHR